jgi:ATP-dependent DNA helicase RecQ
MLRRSYHPIEPRKQWPSKDLFKLYNFKSRNIPPELQASEGRALSLWRDAGWGQLVAQGKYEGGARGVDQFAMTASLEAGGVTISVLAENLRVLSVSLP